MDVIKAVRDVIARTPAIASRLATYNFGSGNEAAVFTTSIFPEDANYPAVRVSMVAAPAFDARDGVGTDCTLQVTVYENRSRSDATAYGIAETIWRTLNWATLSMDSGSHVATWAEYPINIADDLGFVGYAVTVRVMAHI